MSAYALPGLFPPIPRKSDEASCSHPSSGVAANHEDTSDRVGISVKDARIDSALLVHSLATNNDTSSTISPRSRRRTIRGEWSGESSKDEAMKFELSVSFGGNKYTTTRSWPSICKFRKDLIRSVRSIEIPELPSLHPPGVLCRSFSFLQDLVCSYVPTLEGWLRKVTVLVPPDNPILSHFLHESETDCIDTTATTTTSSQWKLESDKFPSFTHLLGAIEESVEENDDKDDRVDDIMLGVSTTNGERLSILQSK